METVALGKGGYKSGLQNPCFHQPFIIHGYAEEAIREPLSLRGSVEYLPVA
jgi:hypothetical protein